MTLPRWSVSLELSALNGAGIIDVAQTMQHVANLLCVCTTCRFNDIVVSAVPGGNWPELVNYYYDTFYALQKQAHMSEREEQKR